MSSIPPTRAAELSREVRSLAGPAVVHNLLLTGVFLVDAIMIGWLGTAPLAAVAIAGPVLWGIRSLFNALGRGTLALVARAVGAGNRPLASCLAQESIVLMFLLALAALPLAGAAPAVYAFFRADPDVTRAGSAYMSVLLAGLPVTVLAHVLTLIFQAAGDTRTPLYAGIASNVFNVVGNYMLMFGACGFPRLGIAGAAWSTVGSHVLMVLALGAVLAHHRSWVPATRRAAAPAVHLPDTSTRAARLRALVRIGTPALGEALAYHTAYLVFSRMVAGLGTQALAAHRIAISVESLAFMPADGFSVAAATITGQSLGAGRPAEALLGIRTARTMGVLGMVPLSLAFLIAPGWIASWFTSDPALTAPTVALLRLAALEIPFLAATSVMIGGLQGAGDTRSALAVTLAGAWVVRLPATWLLGYTLGFGVAGVWLATTVDWAVRSRIAALIVRGGRWGPAMASQTKPRAGARTP